MTGFPSLEQLLGPYRLEKILGRGGMGQVYLAQDTLLGRNVALKVIDAQLRSDPAYIGRFVREARAVAAWNHPNIVQVYDAGEQDGWYYFVMEYIEGITLRDLIAQYAARGLLLPHDLALRIGQALGRALDYAHLRNVIHRDVKPANVLIAGDLNTPTGRIVLTDFGLALDASSGSLGEVAGSAHYIAPEQARRSSDAAPQSDLYSL